MHLSIVLIHENIDVKTVAIHVNHSETAVASQKWIDAQRLAKFL
jgi:hypothetical protein